MKNNIKPGTICTLTKNHSIIFLLSRIDDNGWPYTKRLISAGRRTWDSEDDDFEDCVAYTNLFEEATPEQKQMFESISSLPFDVDTRVPRKMRFKSESDLHEKMKKYNIKNKDILSFVHSDINGDAVWILTDREYIY